MNSPEPTATREPYRRLILLDMVGIVAACALGVWGWTVHARDVAARIKEPYIAPESFREWLNFSSTMNIALAIGVVLREWRSQPRVVTLGGSACLAVVVAATVFTLDEFVADYNRFRFEERLSLGQYTCLSFVTATWQLDRSAGVVVATVAVWLRLVGDRRAKGGIDRLGRGVGCWFLLAWVAGAIEQFREMINQP